MSQSHLVIDGGMAKYTVNYKGKDIELLELSKLAHHMVDVYCTNLSADGYTLMIDLGVDFDLSRIPMELTRRPKEVPLCNRAGVFHDATDRYIFSHGGHFYDSWGYNESEYYVNEANVPPYSLWRFDTKDRSWANMNPSGDVVQRALAGAKCSVPSQNVSYYIG